MRIEYLTESQASLLEISDREGNALARAGRSLASDRGWWGGAADGERDDRSIIDCQPVRAGKWRIVVRDAVGVIAVDELQLVVRPKIPESHLLYLFCASGHFPRWGDGRAALAANTSLWTLLAQWYVSAVEKLLRQDLLRDYAEQEAVLQTKRGKVSMAGMVRDFWTGRVGFPCRYEEFNIDSPLNRVLKSAVLLILQNPLLNRALRSRASALRTRMVGIGDLRPSDMRVILDRRSDYYRDAISLAMHLLRWQGRALAAGESVAWTFLIRTPEMVEDGVRAILAAGLGAHVRVEKKGVQLRGPKLTLTPDMIFAGGQATGDVKYRLAKPDWPRADLYQAVAFANAYRTRHAGVIGFTRDNQEPPSPVGVGDIEVQYFGWQAAEDVTPQNAGQQLVNRVGLWLNESTQAAVVTIAPNQQAIAPKF